MPDVPKPLELARTSASASLPPSPPVVVQVLDQLGDIVGCALLAWLCSIGKLSGLEAGGLILSLLGVQTGMRRLVGAAKGSNGEPPSAPPAAGLGVVALLLLGLFAGHSGHTQAGFGSVRLLRAISLGVLLCTASAVLGCASQGGGDGMQQLVSGYSTFRSIAARVCTVVMALPPPPTPSAPLDAGVP